MPFPDLCIVHRLCPLLLTTRAVSDYDTAGLLTRFLRCAFPSVEPDSDYYATEYKLRIVLL